MALHEQCIGATDEWYTPERVFDALGCQFDMDVAHPGAHRAYWVPATNYITESMNGLTVAWQGFIWMNPPFGKRNGLVPWLEKFVTHGNGIALVPDRTSAPWWQQFAPAMDLTLFVGGKLHFIPGAGQRAGSPAQGTCLMAIGAQGCAALRRAASVGLGFLAAKEPSKREKEFTTAPIDERGYIQFSKPDRTWGTP